MNVKILKKKDEKDWQKFISNHKESRIYHTLEWKEILKKTYGYEPIYLITRNDEDEVQGVLPIFGVKSFIFGKRMVSLPYSHSVGILYQNEDALKSLINFAMQLCVDRGYNYLEIKQRNILPKNIDLIEEQHYVTHILDLSMGMDNLKKCMHKSRRRAINRTLNKGVQIRKGSTLNDVKEFYEILLGVRKSQGSPPYAFKFFKLLYEFLIKNNLANIYLASWKNTIIFASIIFTYNDEIIAGYAAGYKGPRYNNLHAGELTRWTVLSEGYEAGYKTFDFGISSPYNQGLIDYKSRWGTENIKVPYYYFLNKIDAPPVFDPTGPKFRLLSNIWKHVPIPIAKIVGPYLLKHVG